MRRAAKVDINQPMIVEALQSIGASVCNLSRVGFGCPDLLIGFRKNNILLEIKNPDRGWKLTNDQKIFHANWMGKIEIVEDIDDVLRILELVKRK